MKIETSQPTKLETNRFDVIGLTFLFFSLFPYLKIFETGADLQPLSFLVGIVYIFSQGAKIRLQKKFYLLIITIIIVLFFFIYDAIFQLNKDLLRGLYSYLSIFVHSAVAYHIIKRNPHLLSLVVELAIYIWFIVGLVQNYIYAGFLTFLLSRGIGFDGEITGRGVLSLAVEPTFYGIHCFFLMLFVLLLKNTTNHYSKWKWLSLLALCIIQITLFARSSMVILFIFLIIGNLLFNYLFRKPIYAVLGISIVLVSLKVILSVISTNSRFYFLAMSFLESPKDIFFIDKSINIRLSDIYYSIMGFINRPFGHGLNSWKTFFIIEPANQIFEKNEQTRIMSFLGSFLFEIGIFSYFIFYFIFTSVKNFLKAIKLKSYSWYLVAFIILLTSIQQSYPPLWLLLSSAIILTTREKFPLRNFD